MPSDILTQTAQGAVLSMISNILAQVITAYRNDKTFTLNLEPIMKFAIFSVISNPPNIVWQTFLEDSFPTNVPSRISTVKSEKSDGKPIAKPQTQMSKTNILIKFLLDQTLGAWVNTVMFLVFMGYMNGGTWDSVWGEVGRKFWPMCRDGLKLWPGVSLVSFMWVPVEKRVLFGCLVGVGWGIYLSMMVD